MPHAGRAPAGSAKRSRSGRVHPRRLLRFAVGIADWLGWSPFKVRLLFVLASCLFVAVPGILIYIVLWFLMPLEEE